MAKKLTSVRAVQWRQRICLIICAPIAMILWLLIFLMIFNNTQLNAIIFVVAVTAEFSYFCIRSIDNLNVAGEYAEHYYLLEIADQADVKVLAELLRKPEAQVCRSLKRMSHLRLTPDMVIDPNGNHSVSQPQPARAQAHANTGRAVPFLRCCRPCD